MKEANAVIYTEILEERAPTCDHGCRTTVRLTNVVTGATWQMCHLSFERFIGNALQALECAMRDSAGTQRNDGPF
ncbi:hypothetical protein GCM10025857_02110 [Alicyclobacillus contaminans]|uniref:hypothetical protein n=1 Tax=Alicyclobacillus contaminans TaxID=392016 RepID=UPI0004089287|nr:hypothetical protein [Alicyclobacillus contaminans]GMA48854.1 hypothetical protein GCM10025857_02110 [Alicyclobacillus contaminans]